MLVHSNRIKTTLFTVIMLFISVFPSSGVHAESDTVNLDRPTVRVLSTGSGMIQAKWDEIDGAEFYKVYRANEKYQPYKYIGKTSKTYFTDKNVEKNTPYFYKVTAFANNGAADIKSKSSKSVEHALVTLKTPSIKLSAVGTEKIMLTWGADSEADYFKIYRKKNDGKFLLIASTNEAVYYDDELLSLKTEYTYRIKAAKKVSGKEYTGKTSNVVAFTTPEDWQAERRRPDIDNEWAYFLINKQNYLPEGYADSIAMEVVNNSKKIDARCAEYARQMIKDAADAGYNLTVVSGFRSIATQTYNLDAMISNYRSYGYDYDTAYAKATTQIAPPGSSEHNAALALDVMPSNNLVLSQNFDQTQEFKWLYENSWKYGFIMRYPKGKTDITGYIYEPWHYRFIGLYHAEQIYRSGLCLEEYMITCKY